MSHRLKPHSLASVHVAAALSVALLSMACGGGDGGDVEPLSFGDKVALERQENATQLDIFCDCYADFAFPFESEQACIDGLTVPLDPDIEQCRVEAYELDPESSHAHLDCRLEVMYEATECMNTVYTCADTTTFADCDALRVDGLEACPPLSEAVTSAHMACALGVR